MLTIINKKYAPAYAFLSQMATPQAISKDEIVITVKNEQLIKMHENKKKVISEVASEMFGVPNVPVTMRLPQANDVKQKIPTEQEQQIKTEKKTEDVDKNSVENIQKEVKTEKETTEKTNSTKKIETDQGKMVLDLFDGKYVE